jgi:hypothetical protein
VIDICFSHHLEAMWKETVVAYFKAQWQDLLGRTLNSGVSGPIWNPEQQFYEAAASTTQPRLSLKFFSQFNIFAF